MPLIAPRDPALHLAFRIGDGPSATGPRLGGHGPALEAAPALTSEARYVLTVPFLASPAVYLSVWVNCGTGELLEAMNGGLQSDGRILVVRHGEAPRGGTSVHGSALTPHPLVLADAPGPDLLDDGEGGRVVASFHKLGGRPYCIQEPDLDGAEDLLREGYVQAIQLDFPGSRDALVSGNWPFGDGLFNLFLKEDLAAPAWWAFQK